MEKVAEKEGREMNKTKAQQENVRELLTLVQSNPDLPILPMVDSECCPSDEWSWWMASWGKAEIDEYWQDDERCYIKSKDYDELYDRFFDDADEGVNAKLAREFAEETIAKLPWIKAICVEIIPG